MLMGRAATPRRCARRGAASKRLLLATSATQMRVMEREAEAASGSQKDLTAFLDQVNNSRLRNEVCALPVTCRERILFNQLDAALGMRTVAIPTARTVMTPHELREVAAGYFFLPSPCLTLLVGSQIILLSTEHNPVIVDLYGDALMNLKAPGDAHRRVQHDAIANAFRDHCVHDLARDAAWHNTEPGQKDPLRDILDMSEYTGMVFGTVGEAVVEGSDAAHHLRSATSDACVDVARVGYLAGHGQDRVLPCRMPSKHVAYEGEVEVTAARKHQAALESGDENGENGRVLGEKKGRRVQRVRGPVVLAGAPVASAARLVAVAARPGSDRAAAS
eukprot:jgi/Tetstr1/436424/TSEL_025254.t1